jgi:hypothetical protein
MAWGVDQTPQRAMVFLHPWVILNVKVAIAMTYVHLKGNSTFFQ